VAATARPPPARRDDPDLSVGARPDILILCYHAVSSSWPAPLAVTPEALDRQLRHVLKRGYVPRTLSAALAAGGRSVVVSFDDAFRSVRELGLPLMRGLGVPGTLFVPTDFAAEAAPMTWSELGRWRGTEHEGELRCLGWEGIRELAEAGWEVGSHTASHPKLTEIPEGQRREELERSRAACEEALQRPCPTLAYPFGAHDDAVVSAAAAAGYGAAVTLGLRLLEPRLRRDRLRLSREGVYRDGPWHQFLLATSPLLGRVREASAFRRPTPA
jgi:peptidoglycan/xylan/chitin deacetylase (PgdA/CDA1 family)